MFQPGNQEAKKKGPNKISSKVKEAIACFLEDNVGQIQESFDQLKPREKLEFISDLLPYAVPKLSSVSNELSGEIVNKWEVTLNINGTNRVHAALDAGVPNENS